MNILAFDSIYILYPIRKIYLLIIKIIKIKRKNNTKNILLYRLDSENIFLNSKNNISGIKFGFDNDHINLMSIKLYKFLESRDFTSHLLINNTSLYKIQTRQMNLKLMGALKCAYRVIKYSEQDDKKIILISDTQTNALIKEIFVFLNYQNKNINFLSNIFLTICVSINSILLRGISILRMYLLTSKIPDCYYHKSVNENLPTLVLMGPKKKPEIYYSTYVSNFNTFNIILYNLGDSNFLPETYKRIKVKKKTYHIKGLFNLKNMFFTAGSYISDILIINKNHVDLNLSFAIVDTILKSKIDAIISNKQTLVLDNYLALEGRKKRIFILADIMEEVYFCNEALISTKIDLKQTVNLALDKRGSIHFKGTNSLIKYRINETDANDDDYLHNLLNIDFDKKIFFFASDPLKEETQRYLTEKFLINYFSHKKDYILCIKTHHQDDGNITNSAYVFSKKPSNVILIGDMAQKKNFKSNNFLFFEQFNFNAAIKSSNGFLTSSSTSIFQALALDVKSGIIDLFKNQYFLELSKFQEVNLIENEKALDKFIKIEKIKLSDKFLKYTGLNYKNNELFNFEEYVFKCLRKFNSIHKK